ncbi:MAG: 3-methyl-2-oxobutanoate hydroxymethyltransferase [bacterium]|nr:3-methyl-2-oxobutanoate hydroxymethyltransferase [bacterium]
MKYLSLLNEKKKNKEKITALTAYDYPTARILDESGIDIVLVGDSYAMVKLGHETTLPVTMTEMLSISQAVSRGIRESILIIDMPFLSYQVSEAEAMYNIGLFFKETKAQAVKIEATANNISLIGKIVKMDVPIMAHIGLTPQSVYRLGGYRIQGKDAESAYRIYEQALALEKAGVCSLVLEGMTSELSQRITEELSIPTIGIGAGLYCDGQILVIDDLLGMNPDYLPKHTKQYADLYGIIRDAVGKYMIDVEQSRFPEEKHFTHLEEKEKFYKKIKA